MHLVYIGNVKKVLAAFVDGKFGFLRLNVIKVQILDARMLILRDYCSSVFNCCLFNTTKYSAFKATEFKQLLLYTSTAVLRDVFLNGFYKHRIVHFFCF